MILNLVDPNMFTSFLKRLLIVVAAALFLLLNSTASASAETPEVMLEKISQELISTLKAEREAIREKPVRLFELVDKILTPHVDMQRMSRWVLGKYWRTATEEQRGLFTREFHTLLVRFYAAALLDDPDRLDELLANLDEGIITFQPARLSEDASQSIVKASVHLLEGPEIPVSFRLYKDRDKWKVIDVTVDGISLVTNYRGTFASEINRDGLETMLKRLTERNRELLEQTQNSKAGTLATSHPLE
jgi:phospholipid transport system substrate-binding protein